MAANRFASLIHRKTNRITLVLVYAFLEWTLIFFILLNSLFSFFILRFADFFGLKRPCLFCSRLDRFFDPSGKSPSHTDLLCDDHALEISKVHSKSKVLESEGVCRACSCSDKFPRDVIEPPASSEPIVVGNIVSSRRTQIDFDWGDISYSHTRKPIGDEIQIHEGHQIPIQSIFVGEEEKVVPLHLNDSLERSYIREEKTEEKLPSEIEQRKEEEEVNNDDEEFSCYVSSFDCNKEVTAEKEEENKVDLVMEAEIVQAAGFLESCTDNQPTESTPRNLEFYIDDQDCHLIPVEFFKPGEEVREISDINGDFILDFGAEADFAGEDGGFPEENSASASPEAGTNLDDSLQMQNDEETDAEVSIGTEIPDHDQIGDFPSHQITPHDDDHDEAEESTLEFRTITIETRRPLGVALDEEQLQETTNSMDSSHSLQNAMFHLHRRGSETESIDTMECPDGVLTVDKLKSELEEERKALHALYRELEEERNASAIAANETMAMINRLQEEKAAMQMEALQYQRMMEEQSEFDQEALQLLNELMVKREKELEVYRKKLDEYEAKEKIGMFRRRRDSSADSEERGEFQEHIYRENEMMNTPPADVVIRLDGCLDDYEGERQSILERLKFLEEKLTALNDEEEHDYGGSINGNGHFQTNGKHKVVKSKRLLPLFDAVDGEMENGNGNHQENGVVESENGEITVEEEVEELYERLEALEADREFLRHCVGSLRKGDKGLHLLHEILQHLRDLKNIDVLHVEENGLSFEK